MKEISHVPSLFPLFQQRKIQKYIPPIDFIQMMRASLPTRDLVT